MKAFLLDWNGINGVLRGSVYRDAAVTPASPWLTASAPKAPRVAVTVQGDQWQLDMRSATSEPARFFIIRANRADGSVRTLVTSDAKVDMWDTSFAEIRVQDRAGNLSEPTTVMRPGLR